MIRTLVVFFAGVYIGQEYGNLIPSVKKKSGELFETFKQTDLYKKVVDDFKSG